MDIIRSLFVILFLVFLFSTQNTLFSLGMICKQSERRSLFSFKQDLKDPYENLISWSGENCCRWVGVHCNNITDHVIKLHLQNLGLGGHLNPSLLELKQLRHLDLSLNDFEGISIPDFVGSLQSLRYLNLSSASFGGMIPHQLGNLSNLRYLDLSSSLRYERLSVVGNFQWISHLSSLEYLDLSYVNLRYASNWFHVVNMLPSLFTLRLSYCALPGALPSLSYVNLTSLVVLDLKWNKLNSTLPDWLYSLSNLEQLDLSYNFFQETISASSIANLTKLTVLSLNANDFRGTITASIGNLTKLTLLDMSLNQFEGEIPTAFGNLCKLQKLDLSSNKLMGEISGFIGSSSGCIAGNLQSLVLHDNQLSGHLPNQLGRFQNLDFLHLGSNSFSGSIPFSIGRLISLSTLDLSYNELSGSVPESFRNLSKLVSLRLSYNDLEGIVSDVLLSTLTSLEEIELQSLVLKISPDWIPHFQLTSAKLRDCQLGPGFPNWIQTQKLLRELDLSNTGISGTVPTWFWNLSSQFFYLSLSHNQLNGELPRLASNVSELNLSNNSFSGTISTSLCNPLTEQNQLQVLDLSNNLLSGDLSHCWSYCRSLQLVRLEYNNITGNIPSSMGTLLELKSLHLHKNNLSGELPLSLRNCTLLTIVDIGENVLSGRLPIWLGESFPDLIVLRLRLNKFHGEIPQGLCDMTSLQILDLAHNNLSGSIPRCFSNFRAMATKQNSSWPIYYSFTNGEYVETTSLVTKGTKLKYTKTLTLVTSMDLSTNNFSGEIPEEITSLIGLRYLNLSDNHLTGKIPEKIGNMSLLESLDFSKNSISGVIPKSISGISSLSHLNLSYNNLSGNIPLGTQLQTFIESSYIGNRGLCGSPLKYCNAKEPLQKPGDGNKEIEDEDWFEMKWFDMSMGVGFAIGFWAFWGVFIFRFPDYMKS